METEAAEVEEASRASVHKLAEQNRAVALEQLENILTTAGASREARLTHILRVSNRYLVEQQAGGGCEQL